MSLSLSHRHISHHTSSETAGVFSTFEARAGRFPEQRAFVYQLPAEQFGWPEQGSGAKFGLGPWVNPGPDLLQPLCPFKLQHLLVDRTEHLPHTRQWPRQTCSFLGIVCIVTHKSQSKKSITRGILWHMYIIHIFFYLKWFLKWYILYYRDTEKFIDCGRKAGGEQLFEYSYILTLATFIRHCLTFGVVIDTLHQNGVFSDALSDQ